MPIELATFGAGCFWCIEAALQQLDGVIRVRPGYMGGATNSPSYRDVCTGSTGHAEVVQVEYEPTRISYDTLLDWFFKVHDPTTLNRQGNDVGTQYRSSIFFHTTDQRAAAESKIAELQPAVDSAIVTEVTEASTFWVGEEEHHNYYQRNRSAGYCQVMIRPKLSKLGLDE